MVCGYKQISTIVDEKESHCDLQKNSKGSVTTPFLYSNPFHFFKHWKKLSPFKISTYKIPYFVIIILSVDNQRLTSAK